jgi:hypothetical protein
MSVGCGQEPLISMVLALLCTPLGLMDTQCCVWRSQQGDLQPSHIYSPKQRPQLPGANGLSYVALYRLLPLGTDHKHLSRSLLFSRAQPSAWHMLDAPWLQVQ